MYICMLPYTFICIYRVSSPTVDETSIYRVRYLRYVLSFIESLGDMYERRGDK